MVKYIHNLLATQKKTCTGLLCAHDVQPDKPTI